MRRLALQLVQKRQQLVPQLQLVQEQQQQVLVQLQEQELLLFYRKQRGQQQR